MAYCRSLLAHVHTLLVAGLVGGSALLSGCSESFFTQDGGAGESPWHYDGTSQQDLVAYVNPCSGVGDGAPPSVSGKVYAPNGVDPVAGASVHVALGYIPLPPAVRCESCGSRGAFSARVYAKPDGSFKLERVPLGVPFKLGIQKGYFKRYLTLTVPSCNARELQLTKAQTTLPGHSKQYGPYDTIPRIAVITGNYDKLEKVLEKLGVPVDQITLYNGKDYGTGPDSGQNLLQNAGLMKSYHLIFINCGIKFEPVLATTDGIIQRNIRAYVRAGGRLFVTDLAYDFVEQVFPPYIDFYGSESTPADVPEEQNAAEYGQPLSTLRASIVDAALTTWLGLPEINALLPRDPKKTQREVLVQGFNTAWTVQKAAVTTLGTKVWVTAGIPAWWLENKSVTVPLTTSFEYRDQDKRGCGRVVFSSYHTYGEATQLLPQERLLEYLMLEIGTCVLDVD